jgi:hypothetical protein
MPTSGIWAPPVIMKPKGPQPSKLLMSLLNPKPAKRKKRQ